MQGTFETERIIRTRPYNEKHKERKKYGEGKTLRTREREVMIKLKRQQEEGW